MATRENSAKDIIEKEEYMRYGIDTNFDTKIGIIKYRREYSNNSIIEDDSKQLDKSYPKDNSRTISPTIY